MQAAIAGAAYFAAVFAAGFLLGAIRVLLIVPHSGETIAVLLEAPLILAASWRVCRWSVAHFHVAPAVGMRLVMGLVAFGLLQSAELGVATLIFQRSLVDHLTGFRSAAGVIGLLAQCMFALFPLLIDRRAHGVSES